jgi:hypothetical protein
MAVTIEKYELRLFINVKKINKLSLPQVKRACLPVGRS